MLGLICWSPSRTFHDVITSKLIKRRSSFSIHVRSGPAEAAVRAGGGCRPQAPLLRRPRARARVAAGASAKRNPNVAVLQRLVRFLLSHATCPPMQRLHNFLESTWVNAFTVTVTFWALFGDDIRLMVRRAQGS